jgi:hypothetical protein
VEIITRAEWGADEENSSRTPWNPNDLLGVCIHHFAIPRSAATRAGSDDLMRSVQRAHIAGEFTDIAYNHCFDKWGQIFEGRGFRFQTGANGNQAVNRTHAAICYMGNSDLDGFPEAAQDAAGWLLKQWFRRGTGLDVAPHSRLSPTGTSCPGDNARSWVTSGAWKRDLPVTRRVQFLLMDDGEIIDQSARVPPDEAPARWRIFRNSDAGDRAYNRMAAEDREGGRGTVTFARKTTTV